MWKSQIVQYVEKADRRMKRMKIWTLAVPCIEYVGVGYISCLNPWVHIGVIWCTLQKFDVKIFKSIQKATVFIQFQPNFTELKHVIGGNKGYYFFWRFEKYMALWR